jgi:two-component system response regulator QseB
MRVLIAEDNPDTTELFKLALAKTPFRIDFATTGVEALARFHAAERDGDPYALMVLDVAMPMKTGVTALEEIRGEGYTTPAMFFTALEPRQIEPDAKRLKAEVIYKPDADIRQAIKSRLEGL